LNEYKSEAFLLFNVMLDDLKERVVSLLSRVEFGPEPPPEPRMSPLVQEVHPSLGGEFGVGAETAVLEPVWGDNAVLLEPPRRSEDEDSANRPVVVGRNAPCPCGSGKKYKHCHGMAG